MADIAETQNGSFGEIDLAKGVIRFGLDEDTGATGFKDARAFAMKGNEICYALVPAHAWNDDKAFDNEWLMSECRTYTYKDILDVCEGNEKIAETVFAVIRDESPESFYRELEDWEKAEVAAGVDLSAGYELLEYISSEQKAEMGSDFDKIVWDLYFVHGAGYNGYVCYCSYDEPNEPANLNRLFKIDPHKGDQPLCRFYKPENEVRFVSVTDAKLPDYALIHNEIMQEKAALRPNLIASAKDAYAAQHGQEAEVNTTDREVR